MILCEGQDIEEKAMYAADLVDFLAEQVGSTNVDTALSAPEPAPTSQGQARASSSKKRLTWPMSAEGGQVEKFFIGDEEKPSATQSMSMCDSKKLFFIGDVKAVGKRRHTTKAFFIGDGTPEGSSEASGTRSPAKERKTARTEVYPSPRLVCSNLLAEDSDASTTYSESGSPMPGSQREEAGLTSASRTQDSFTRQKMIDFTRVESQTRQDGAWNNWACVLGCGGRDRS